MKINVWISFFILFIVGCTQQSEIVQKNETKVAGESGGNEQVEFAAIRASVEQISVWPQYKIHYEHAFQHPNLDPSEVNIEYEQIEKNRTVYKRYRDNFIGWQYEAYYENEQYFVKNAYSENTWQPIEEQLEIDQSIQQLLEKLLISAINNAEKMEQQSGELYNTIALFIRTEAFDEVWLHWDVYYDALFNAGAPIAIKNEFAQYDSSLTHAFDTMQFKLYTTVDNVFAGFEWAVTYSDGDGGSATIEQSMEQITAIREPSEELKQLLEN